MSFDFVKELCEARLFKNLSKLDNTKISELADSFFNAVLGLEILRRTDAEAAKKYAQQTLAYGNLNGWRSSGSDLHNMAHVLINKNRYTDKLRIDRVVSVPELQFKTYLKSVAAGSVDSNFTRRFLFNLQKGLAIGDQGLRSARRILGDWDTASIGEKQLASTRIYMGLYKDLQQSDFWLPISRTMKRNKLYVKDAEIPKSVKVGTPLWAKLALTGVAGYAITKKLNDL